MNKNLYAFGDSYCKYMWPMWPDILGQIFDKYFNFGAAGCGNFRIFHDFLNYLPVPIDSDSTVIIQWTEPYRFDFFSDEYTWQNLGSGSVDLFLKNKKNYQYNDEEISVCKQLCYMLSIANALNNANVNWYFLFLNDESMVHKYNTQHLPQEGDIYRSITDLQMKLNVYQSRMVDCSIMSHNEKNNMIPQKICPHNNEIFTDGHPFPYWSFLFVREHLLPLLPNCDERPMKKFIKRTMAALELQKKGDVYYISS